MKKFSDVARKTKRIVEQDEANPQQGMTPQNIPQNIPQNMQMAQNMPQKTEIPEVGQEGSTVVKFFSKLFESREMAHIYHLQVTDSGAFAAHKALEEYYDGILDFIDTIIEVYQGQYGIVDGYDVIDTSNIKSKEPIAYFEELVEYIKNARKCIAEEDTHLHNIIDEVIALIYKTLYKLKNLK